MPSRFHCPRSGRGTGLQGRVVTRAAGRRRPCRRRAFGQADDHAEPGGALGEGSDGALLALTGDEVAFPVAGTARSAAPDTSAIHRKPGNTGSPQVLQQILGIK
jgi:hypothetical protein